MAKLYCCMPNCSNYAGKLGRFGKIVKLHKLPRKATIRKAWIIAISRKCWSPTSYTRVCSDHFPEGNGPDRKNSDKIPSENLAQKARLCRPKPVRKKPPTERNATGILENKYDVDISLQTSVQISLDLLHSYSKKEEFHSEAYNGGDDNNATSVSSQTTPENQDECFTVQRPDISVEDIKHSDDQMQFYTGLPNYETFSVLFDTLLEYGMQDEKDMTGFRRKLSLMEEFFMVMMRLRLGLLVKDLEFRFKISSSSVSRIFSKWISFMSTAMLSMVFLPPLSVLQKKIPPCFKSFSDSRIILDCTKIFVQTPSSLECQSQTYSNYKSHNTFKALVGVSMTGAVCFVSKLWGGSASDVHITRESGLLDLLEAGDAVMVDKGFVHIKQDLEKKQVKLYCPPFKTKTQFSKKEVELTRRIASARIHVERKMEQIKNFRILQGILPLALSPLADDIFFVCSTLTNLLPPLVTT